MAIRDEDCVQLCEEGDVLYRISKHGIDKVTIIQIFSYPHYVYKDNQGHTYFNRTIKKSCRKTLEEAQTEVKRRENIKVKKEMLKKYEAELNDMLNIGEQFYIK